MSNLPEVNLSPQRETPVVAGHPWIFSKAIQKGPLDEAGAALVVPSLVNVLAHDGKFLGVGMYNPKTSIAIRMLSLAHGKNKKTGSLFIDADFFVKRFEALEKEKKEFLPSDTNGYRLVNADADWLPGLIIDRYNNVFVFQIHTAGMDAFRDQIIEALKTTFNPVAIVERSDIESRKADGLTSLPVKIHFGEIDEPVEFMENGVKFLADVLTGQKTGFFLDQREARKKVGELSKGKKVLNLFAYTGGFGVYAALNGAEKVTTVDISENALELAVKNFQLNGIKVQDKSNAEKYEFIAADVFEFLSEVDPGYYDIIVCDPPAFAKSNDRMEQATKAYTDLNRRCLALLNEGGILLTSSCSGRLTQENFRDILRISAGRAGKDVRILANLSQPIDHTERAAFSEGRYLKTLVVQCLEHF